MKISPYQRGGPVPPESKVYIQRHADVDSLVSLRNMEYLLIFEPRQQGKSSLIGRVSYILKHENFIIVPIQMNDLLDYREKGEWFFALYQMIYFGLEDAVGSKEIKTAIPVPDANIRWPSYLRFLAEFAFQENLKMVLVFDEAGAISSEWATPFFSAIRSVYHHRLTHQRYKHLTFIVSGTFNPWQLIKDPEISDFNTAHQINLGDFSLENIKDLVQWLELDEQEDSVAKRIFEWTSGQPFLVQLICDDLTNHIGKINELVVDRIVKNIISNDTQHIQGIFKHLKNDPKLVIELKKLLGGKADLAINLNEKHFQLVKNIGILSQTKPVKIRNKIYAERLKTFLDQHSQAMDEEEETFMDAIQLVISALISGLLSGMTNTAKSFSGDIYDSFKKRLKKKVEGHEDAEDALAQVEKQPDSTARKDFLAEELSKIGFSEKEDKELISLAQKVIDGLEKTGYKTEIYITNINTSNAPVVIGHKPQTDINSQKNEKS